MALIENIGCFTSAQRFSQITGQCWLLINLSGLKRTSIRLPSGKPLRSVEGNTPFAVLLPSFSQFDFDYGADRENWVLMLPQGSVTESTDGMIRLSWEGINAEFPGFLLLDAIQATRVREYLTRILQAYHRPNNEQAVSLNLSCLALLDCILHPFLQPCPDSPAELLRDRILADRGFGRNLSELSLDCGYSPDHIRRLFEARFGVTPKDFRTDYRMRIAKDLLELLSHSVRDVAGQLGYSHPAHFSTAFKKHFGCNPTEVMASGATMVECCRGHGVRRAPDALPH